MDEMPAVAISHDMSGHDHSAHMAMDHSGMDHGGHGGMDHGGMDHGATPCKMNMIWNYDTDGLCLVFPSWQITSTTSLYTSLVAIVLLGVGYEWLRLALRRLDRRLNAGVKQRSSRRKNKKTAQQHDSDASTSGSSATPLLQDDDNPYAKREASASTQSISIAQLFALSTGYALSVAISFFIMLLFMTYNAYVIAAVLVGAGVGHYLFARSEDGDEADEDDRGMSCH